MSAPGRRSFVRVGRQRRSIQFGAWGDAPGFMESRNPSAESAIQLFPSAKAPVNRAFSARIRADEFPGALPQALIDRRAFSAKDTPTVLA